MVARHIYISGKVQGVSFRFHTFERANKLGITGWIRNLEDGRVECVAVAPNETAMNELLGFLQSGPPNAKVEGFEVTDVPKDKTKYNDFSIRRDMGPTW